MFRESFGGLVGLAEQAVGAGHVVFHRLAGDAELAGYLLVGEILDLAQEEDLPAARGQAEQYFLEAGKFLARADEVLDGGRGARGHVELRAAGGIERMVAPPADFVECEAARGGEEQQTGLARATGIDGGLDANEGVLRDILRLRLIPEQPGQISSQWLDRGAVESVKVPTGRRRMVGGIRWKWVHGRDAPRMALGRDGNKAGVGGSLGNMHYVSKDYDTALTSPPLRIEEIFFRVG